MGYNHKKIESNWQKKWEKDQLYKTSDDQDKPKYYILDMFPYPSGAGLHVGHPKGYIATDVTARMKMMQGYNVLHPMGWDAFGLPAENYAIKNKVHPRVAVEKNIKVFKKQLGRIGFTHDWSREVNTTDPDYYKWTQWAFIQMFKKGLAYESDEPIIWCPSCQTGLAMEDLEDGKCERCGSDVERKPLRQWVLKITDYADRLLFDLDSLDKWPDSIREMQKNWIGRSEGAKVKFEVRNWKSEIEVFTTRPDTLFGATFMVLSPEHELVNKITTKENEAAMIKYQEEASKKSDLERTELQKDKSGVFTGAYAINPVNKKEIPIWIADYVLASYGTGAIMAVPAHDQRDYDFAKKYKLDIVPVVLPDKASYLVIEKSLPQSLVKDLQKYGKVNVEKIDKDWGGFYRVEVELDKEPEFMKFMEDNLLESSDDGGAWYTDSMGTTDHAIFSGKTFSIKDKKSFEEFKKYGISLSIPKDQLDIVLEAFTDIDNGTMINSQQFDGQKPKEAIKKIIDWLEKEGIGEKAVTYRLQDWVFSRQRYWGEPIPIVHCPKCGAVPVDEKDLPVVLPEVKNYEPSGTGESPLAGIDDWVNTQCPKCGVDAKRETNTMPQWAGSNWYYLRYIDPDNKDALVDYEKEKYWSPVDFYVGGAEHATRHLIYSRFWHKFLFDIGAVNYQEPFTRLQNVGLIMAEDGRKMSKRWGNVINPDDIIDEYGADSLRVYEMFMGPFDQAVNWDTNGLRGTRKFLEKIFKFDKWQDGDSKEAKTVYHQMVKKVTNDVENLRFNTAVSAMMIFVNKIVEIGCSKEIFQNFLKVLSPFAPHLAEELWVKSGKDESIFLSKWPEYDESQIQVDTIQLVIQVNGKVRDKIQVEPEIAEAEVKKLALASEKVQKFLEGKESKKIIYVKGKLLSIVV
ncbi:leucine--tRNA ligase [Candidatus Falkowbacteria bacterium]|jgi:leucyl-tRNA synthetase|nr:leucine--tRNA ligase [Candidatus Falkowbacteria bacterium]MBT7006972.1 leucine--tRNA ligase [Candidatus Falkowbacteria bacterium]